MLSGNVKFFNDAKGFGFIEQDNNGPDLFFHRNDVSGGGLLDGDQVRYDEQQNERNGKMMALNITGGTGGESWGKPGGGKSGGGKGKGKGKKYDNDFGGGKRDGGMRDASMGGPVKSGVVKFFNEEKGFGFVSQHDGGPDVFVHRRSVSGGMLVEGDEVQYEEVQDDRNGKMQAINVSGGSGGEGFGKGFDNFSRKGGGGYGKGRKGGGGGFGGGGY